MSGVIPPRRDELVTQRSGGASLRYSKFFEDVTDVTNVTDSRITANESDIAQLQIDVGNNTTAIGNNTTAIGNNTTAIGNNTTAIGNNTTAIGNNTTAIGNNTTAIGNNTTAIGNNTTAIGNNTTAIGNNTTAIGNNTTAIGNNTTAIGLNTTAIAALAPVLSVQTGAYTTSVNEIVLCNAAITVSLNATPDDAEQVTIKRVAGSVTVSGNGNNIDGAASVILAVANESLIVVYSDTLSNWYIL